MLGQAYEVRLSFALKWGCHPAAILTLMMTSRASRSTEWPGAPERGRPSGPEPIQLGQARGLHLDRPAGVSLYQVYISQKSHVRLVSGTGFATVDEDGFVADEDQMAVDFVGFPDRCCSESP